MKQKALLLAGIFLFSSMVFSQNKKLSVSVKPEQKTVKAGQKANLIITCEIADGFHISDVSSGMFSVKPEPAEGVEFGKPEYPEPDKDPVAGFVYRGTIKIKLPFKVVSAKSDVVKAVVSVNFQPCTEDGTVCYPPDRASGSTQIKVSGKAIKKAEQIIKNTDKDTAVDLEDQESSGMAGKLSRALSKGSWMAFLIVFLGGLLTSFTPCVYPMIPITIAVIGAQASGGKLKGFILSLFYVLGIAVTFTTLGVVAAKTGALFGTFAQHPVALIIISTIFFVMGLSMLGVFIVQVPSSISSKLSGKKRKGFLGAFLTGLIAGIVVSPCVSPLLVVILTWVAKTGSVLLGAGLLFIFSLGLGVLFILIGTFSGVLKALPKSGTWMEFVEKGFGIILTALAIFFIKNAVPAFIYSMLWAAYFIVFATYTGAFNSITKETTGKEKLSKSIAVIFLVIGISIMFFTIGNRMGFQARTGISGVTQEESMWYNSDDIGLQKAAELNKPVVIDFYADWCAACKELDEKTWSKSEVMKTLENYIPIKLDMTLNDEKVKKIQAKYKIVGMPTVIILSSSGKELYRFEGFKGHEEVNQILKKYL